MADKCGAKTRAGGRCRKPKMPNGRCRFHGGMSTGPKKYNAGKNNLRHGIYSRHFTEEECKRSAAVPLASVDELIFATQTMLDRAIGAYARQKKIAADATVESAILAGDSLEIVEIIERPGLVGFGAPKEIKARLYDFPPIIDRLTARLESLKRTRAELLKQDLADPEEEDNRPIGRIVVEVVSARVAPDHDRAAS